MSKSDDIIIESPSYMNIANAELIYKMTDSI